MSETQNPWKIKKEKLVYDNPWIRLTEYDVINPAGGEGIYGKVHFKNAAIAVIALDEDRYTYLVGQHRFVLDAYSWEIPEGGCPEGEAYLDAAKRELQEETGLVAGNWTELMRMHLSNSVSDEFGILFLAQNLKQGPSAPEDTEDIRMQKLPFETVVKMVEEGRITDALSIIAIQKIQLMLLQGKI